MCDWSGHNYNFGQYKTFIGLSFHRMKKMRQVTLMRGRTTVSALIMSSALNPQGVDWIICCTRPTKVSQTITHRQPQGWTGFPTSVTVLKSKLHKININDLFETIKSPCQLTSCNSLSSVKEHFTRLIDLVALSSIEGWIGCVNSLNETWRTSAFSYIVFPFQVL